MTLDIRLQGLTLEQRVERLENLIGGPSPLNGNTLNVQQVYTTTIRADRGEIENVVAEKFAEGGVIGGWVIINYELRNQLTGANRVGLRPSSWPFYAGDEEPSIAPFRVNPAGEIWATNAHIAGEIDADSGAIGGWTIAASELYAGTGANRVGLQPGAWPFYAGSETPSAAPFRVNTVGEIWATNAHISGEIDANSGTIGNLDVDGNLYVGVSGTRILIDGPNKRIRSTNYSEALAGFNIGEDGNAEFNNVTVRGSVLGSSFAKNLISAHAGTLLITKSSGVLSADFTPGGTMTIKSPPGGGWLFDTGDIVRLKKASGASVVETWVTVTRTAVENQYTTTLQSGDTGSYTKGTVVVDYGPSGEGGLMLSADMTNAPWLKVFTHAGSPWTSITERLRIGNLNGWGDFSSDTYGWAVGDYSGGKYAFYEPSAGMEVGGLLRLKGGEAEGDYEWLIWDKGGEILGTVQSFQGTFGDGETGNCVLIASHNTAGAQLGGLILRSTYYSGSTYKYSLQMASAYLKHFYEGDTSKWSFEAQAGPTDTVTKFNGAVYLYRGGSTLMGQLSTSDTTWLRINQDVAKNIYTPRGASIAGGLVVGNTVPVTPTDDQIRLYRGSTLMGQLSTSDTFWLRINQNVAKNIYTPRMFRADGGLAAGSVTAASGEIRSSSHVYFGGSIKQSTALGCRVTRTTSQAIPHNTLTALSFNSEIYDTDNCWSSANPTRMIAKCAGYYMAGGAWIADTAPTGTWRQWIGIRVNGTTYVGAQDHTTTPGIDSHVAIVSGMIYLTAGDYVEIIVYQNSGGTIYTEPATSSYQHTCYGWIMRIA